MKKLGSYLGRLGIKASLRGYQREAVKVGINNPAFALLMDPRLGKTRAALAVLGYRRLHDGVNRALIVCPSIAKAVWEEEALSVLSIPHRITVVEGKAAERRADLVRWRDEPGKLSIIIVNPEATWRLKRWLYKINPEMVILDESHRIKNHAAKQSISLHTLGRRAVFRCILTGTFMAEPRDAFSQFKFLDPTILGNKWKDDFCSQYVATWGYGGHSPATYKNLDDLMEKVSRVSYILTRDRAGGFPQELSQTFHFDLSPVARRHYSEMEKDLKTLLESHEVRASIVLTQVLRLQQITGGFLPVRIPNEEQQTNLAISPERIQALKSLVSEYSPRTPLVIFARFRYEVSEILRALKSMGRSANFIVGGMSDREQAKKDFQAGVVDTCVAQIKAAGISIDLSRARTSIFYSMTGSYFDYEQARARIIARTGGSVSTLHLVAKDTVDELTLQAVQSRKDLADLLMGR